MNSEYTQKINRFLKTMIESIIDFKSKISEYKEQKMEEGTKKHMDAIHELERELNLNQK